YYGYRYYSPNFGRWISRDPIEEDGGLNVYACARNASVGSCDRLGLVDFSWDSQGFHIRDRGLTYMPVFNDNGTWDVMPKPGHEREFDRVRAKASLDQIMGDRNLFQRMKNAHTFRAVEHGGGQGAWQFFGKGSVFDKNTGDTRMQSVIRRRGRNMWRAMRHAGKVMGAVALAGAISSSLEAADIAESYARHRELGDVAMADLDAIDLAVVIADATGNYYMGYLALDILLEP
ncbi:MAG: RHS repeat-associated core domain-containing protein, partial [Verrucomicrobiia bacterium]